MRRSHLHIAILGFLCASAPAIAAAQQPEEEPGSEPEEKPAEEGGEKPPEPSDVPPPDPELGTWGVGGDEPEGKYKPHGRTGKLKELEKEDEEERQVAEGPPELPPPGYAYLDTAIGFGEISVPIQRVQGEDAGTEVTPTASFLIKIGYRLFDYHEIYVRFPISTGEINGPQPPFFEGARDTDHFKQIATGSLELGFRELIVVSRDLWLTAGLGLAFPTGQGDIYSDLTEREARGQALVNQAAAASRGWEDRALFAYQRFSLIPQFGLQWKIPDLGPGALRITADTKVEIMIKTGGNEPEDVPYAGPEGQEVRGVAVNWVIGPGIWYDLFDGLLSPGIRIWFAVGNGFEKTTSVDPGPVAGVFEPNVATHIPFTESKSVGFDARIGYMIPMGLELGGGNADDAGIGGLRLGAGFFF
jgi:hypothetical protein